MTEEDIDKALEEIFDNKVLKKELGLDRFSVYHLRNRSRVEQKLKVLWQANKLTLK